MTKHPAYLNLVRYWNKEITLSELIELNKKYAPLTEDNKPEEIKTIEKVFGSARPFGAERACPKEKGEIPF
jgi:hypothetical protein